MFGENFTTEGILEDSVHVGDQFAIGSATVIVTQPRLPCYKLGVRFESDDMVKRFLASGRMGFYLAVTREGDVGAGDEIRVIAREPSAVAVPEITRLYLAKKHTTADVASMRRLLEIDALPEGWKDYFAGAFVQVEGVRTPTDVGDQEERGISRSRSAALARAASP